ncbi:unnamed protein product, partial [Vitrella brassicaformis CCMP3155]
MSNHSVLTEGELLSFRTPPCPGIKAAAGGCANHAVRERCHDSHNGEPGKGSLHPKTEDANVTVDHNSVPAPPSAPQTPHPSDPSSSNMPTAVDHPPRPPNDLAATAAGHIKTEIGRPSVGVRPPGQFSVVKSPVDVLPRAGLTNLAHQQLMPLIKREEAMDDGPSPAGLPSNLPTSGSSGASHFCLSPSSIIDALRDNWDRCDLDRPRSTTSVDPCDLSTP